MQKLQIITNEEKFELVPTDFVEDGGVKFFYRRCTTTSYHAIVRSHQQKGGLVDLNAAGIELIEKYLIGWEGLVDETGKEIKFDPKIAGNFPDKIQGELIEAIRGIGGESVTLEKK